MAATLKPTLVIILGVVGGISCSLTIDTGAMVSIIEESMVADASDVQIHPNVNLRVRGLGKSPSADLDVIGTAMITVELSEISVKHPALVVRGLGHSCLLENDFLIEHGVKVDFSNQTVHIRNRTFHFYSEERRLWRKRQTMKFERVATRTVSDGVFFSEDKQNKVNLRRKLVVPKLIRSQALEALHDCLYAGHFGEKHTWESVNQRLYSQEGGCLTKTAMGNRYILTVTDCFTKWTEVCTAQHGGDYDCKDAGGELLLQVRDPRTVLMDINSEMKVFLIKPALDYVLKFLIDMYASILRIESDVGSGQLLVDYSLP
ncbi:hypothetical protein T06_9523 [Trichinella sp. T6]|nr:hypothetical protein T06_9523 [Trichinella sp. T6]